jgi:putative FmdB family regulatory protein
MPKYVYRCPDIHCVVARFELDLFMSQAGDPVACPNCGKEAERVFTVPHADVRGGTPTHHRRDT